LFVVVNKLQFYCLKIDYHSFVCVIKGLFFEQKYKEQPKNQTTKNTILCTCTRLIYAYIACAKLLHAQKLNKRWLVTNKLDKRNKPKTLKHQARSSFVA
jgi:hypothetical protein